MKRIIQKTIYFVAGAALLLPAAGFAAVCGEGIGIPAFLSSGAKPNLLMVLDNSGSMLDAAYSKDGAFCFDDTYLASQNYGGYFKNDTWYKWTDSPYPPWENATAYTAGDRVYVNGIIWEALTTDTSSGGTVATDIGVAWKHVFSINTWKNSVSYTTGTIVWSGPQMYKATNTATSNDPDTSNGLNLTDDQNVVWEAVDSTWVAGHTYATGDIVSYRGSIYEAAGNGTSAGTGAYDDSGVTWNLLNEGEFEEVTATDAAAYCAAAAGTEKHSHADLCVSLDSGKTPKQASAFAARGNILNWAMSSKFDVEKKILTGGKYNYSDEFLTTENRGCSGSRTIKQVPLTDGNFLSLGVRGSIHQDDPGYEDRIDSTDDTGRLEILAVTDTGYQTSEECVAAIDKVVNHGLNGSQNVIQGCLESFPNSTSEMTDMRPALNHSLQACWHNDPSTPFSINNGDFSNLVKHCTALFTGEKIGSIKPSRSYQSSELRPQDGGPYLCYGLYDSGVDHMNRVGYMGRAWIPGGGSGGTTVKTCNPRPPNGECTGADCCWKAGPTADSSCLNYRNNVDYVEQCTASSGSGSGSKTCEPDITPPSECSNTTNCCWGNEIPYNTCTTYRTNNSGYVEQCTATNGNNGKNANKIKECTEWTTVSYNWDDGSGSCSAGDAPVSNDANAVCTQWKILGNWDDGSGTCNYGDAPVAIGGTTTGTGAWEQTPTATPGNPVFEAIKDYCEALTIPETIDPSEVAGKTGDTGNLPGLLRDSELMAFFGGQDALATMKGHIKQAKRPNGVVHNVAADLRLGAMSFHYVGAATECLPANLTNGIEKYCPQNNQDGAELLVPLKNGDSVTEPNDPTYTSGKRRHVDDLAEAINSIRASSWTPLGEALYGALGYYTQNSNFCLNFDADGNCLDFTIDEDPVQYWCQDNHILVITEGESTADINNDVATFPTSSSDRHFLSNESGDNLMGDNDRDLQAGCNDGLYGSSFLDDMTWWGQHALPLYKKRYYSDPDGNLQAKQPISSYIVTTGSLTAGGTAECSPEALMNAAAKNGGTDATPEDTTDDFYYSGEDPQKLEDNLYAVLGDIMSRSSSGSAASVISDSRSGAGAMYQAVFWPQSEDNAEPKNKVTWIGDVRSLLLDSDGQMYEDTNQDGKLDISADLTNSAADGNDKRVVYYYSSNAEKTRGCYNITAYLANNYQCPGDTEEACEPGDDCVEAENIKYLWSANKQLREMNDVTDVTDGRKVFTWNDANNDGIVDDNEWFRLNLDTDWAALNTLATNAGQRGPVTEDFLTADDWGNFVSDDGSDKEIDALHALTEWLLGVDSLNNETTDDNGNNRLDKILRSRQFEFVDTTTTPPTTTVEPWRLGDVIHSAPTAVSNPAEAYNQIYRDPTYSKFVTKWDKRRSVIYFGGNDGMLHAVNGGFHFEEGNQFCCTNELDSSKECTVAPVKGKCSTGPGLGEEVWAYIPYNLQPHLKCLANRFYTHKYFVDKKPRVFDVQIFAEEAACSDPTSAACVHPGGWGTILVGGMRFGGAPIEAQDLNSFTDAAGLQDPRQFTSSFFILDITDPENPPKLLGEMTRMSDDPIGTDSNGDNIYADEYVDLNYTTSTPAMVVMKTNYPAASSKGNMASTWYLVMGNGPTELDGSNHPLEQGKLAVLPLAWLKGEAGSWSAGIPSTTGTKKAIRIPDTEPTATSQGGRFLVPKGGENETDPGYISDMISVDYNIDDYSLDTLGVKYRTDAVYFGTVDGSSFKDYPKDYLPGVSDQVYWNGGGRIFRLVTKVIDSNGDEEASSPSDWAAAWNDGPVRMLADLKMPVVSGPSIGYDGDNYWIYAGTGRFYSEKDKTDDGRCLESTALDLTCSARSENAFFGLKEPVVDDSDITSSFTCDDDVMTWGTIDWNILDHDDNADLTPNAVPGKRGLMRSDNILVQNGTGYLACRNCRLNGSTFECGGELDTCFDVNYPPSNPAPTPAVSEGPIYDDEKAQYTFPKLVDYIAGTGCETVGVNADSTPKRLSTGLDGWYHVFHEPRERNIGTASLLGKMLFFATYQPLNDKCKAEGQSYLYSLYYQTGTASPVDVIGSFDADGNIKEHTEDSDQTLTFDQSKLLIPGLVMPPTLHSGTAGLSTLLTGSTGNTEQKKVGSPALPKSGRVNWTDRRQ